MSEFNGDDEKSPLSPSCSSQESLFKELHIRNLSQMKVPSNARLTGYLLMAASGSFVALYSYCAYFSKILPSTGWWVLDFIRDDHYFCYLVPLIALPTLSIVYLNWLAMAHFEQN